MHLGLLLIISIYFIIIFIIGANTKEIKSLSGFIKAKCSLQSIGVFAGLVMTHYGGGFVLGGGEWGFLYSLKGVIYGFSAGLGILILGLLLAEKSHKLAKPSKDRERACEILIKYFILKKEIKESDEPHDIASKMYNSGKIFGINKNYNKKEFINDLTRLISSIDKEFTIMELEDWEKNLVNKLKSGEIQESEYFYNWEMLRENANKVIKS